MPLSFNSEKALNWLSLEENTGKQHIPLDILSTSDQYRTYGELVQRHLIQDTVDIDGNFSFILTSSGNLRAYQVQDIYRNSFAQFALLQWLSNERHQGEVRDVLETPFVHDVSVGLNEDDIIQAANELENAGMIEVLKAMGGHLLHPKLTPQGRKLQMQKRSLNEHSNSAETISTQINNTFEERVGNMISGSNYGSMEAHIHTKNTGISPDELTSLLHEFKEFIRDSKVNETEKLELQEEIEELKQKAGRKSFNWVRATVARFLGAVTETIGEDAGKELTALTQQYMPIG